MPASLFSFKNSLAPCFARGLPRVFTGCVHTSCPHPQVPEALSRAWRPALLEGLPQVFTGGWVGYAGYDTVRYVYSGKAAVVASNT